MTSARTRPWAEWAVLLFAAWRSRDLLNTWQHSPRDRLGWLALVVWLAPLAPQLVNRRGQAGANAYMVGAAIVCGLLGELAEVHFCNHVALALALAAWLKGSLHALPWMLAAAAWMPVFGWGLADVSSGRVLICRLALALAGVTSYWLIKEARPR